MSKRTLYRGVSIRSIKVERFEVTDANGKKVKTFATVTAAKAFVDGYVLALKRHAPKEPS